MREAKCLAVVTVSIVVFGSLGTSMYVEAQPGESGGGLEELWAPENPEDLLPTPPETPPEEKDESSVKHKGEPTVEGQFAGEGSPPVEPTAIIGDYECTGLEIWENEYIELRGNMVLRPTCEMYFINTLMEVNELWEPKDITITVERDQFQRAYFELTQGSEIRMMMDPGRYEFKVYGKLVVSGSEIHDLQGDVLDITKPGGLQFLSGSIGIIQDGSTISRADTHVIYTSNPSSLKISDSTIELAGLYYPTFPKRGHGIFMDQGGFPQIITISNSEIRNNADYGIYVYRTGVSIIIIPVPLYVPGEDLGYFIWADDDFWHIRWSTINGTTCRFNGTVTSPTTSYSFDEYITTGEGGRDYPAEEPMVFDLWLNDSRIEENKISIGKYNENPDSNPFELWIRFIKVEGGSLIHDNWGGIFVEESSPLIKDNTISFNTVYGVRVIEGSPAIDGNTIADNDRGVYGRSAESRDCSPRYSPIVYGNTFTHTMQDPLNPKYNIGMEFYEYSYPRVRQNSIIHSFKEGGTAIYFNNSKGVVEDNSIYRPPSYQQFSNNGIYISHSSLIVNNNNLDFYSYGIYLYYTKSGTEITWNTVKHAWLGVILYQTAYTWPTISDNRVEYCTWGIFLKSSNAYVINNLATHNVMAGIATTVGTHQEEQKDTYPLISDNDVLSNTNYGILAYDKSRPTIQGNDVWYNGGSGICLCPYEWAKEVGQAIIGGSSTDEKNSLKGNSWGIELTYNKPANFGPWGTDDEIQYNTDQNVFLDPNDPGWIIQKWWTTILVTYQGQSQPYADVKIYSLGGDLVWSGQTQFPSGKTEMVTLREIAVYGSDAWTKFTPHGVYAEKVIDGDLKQGSETLWMTMNRPDFEVVLH